MKFGFFGGLILLILTIVFSIIAIKNNQIARKITTQEFGLEKSKSIDMNRSENRKKVPVKIDEFDKKMYEFNKKFEGFDEEFEKF